MSIVNTSVQQTAALAPTGQAQSAMGGADFNMFLKLLTTQMQNQDPLDPMDTSQYTQQLVQYSQVEQSMQQTGVLRDILSRLTATDLAQASGFIGREVEFDTNFAGLTDKPAEWSYSMPREVTSITAVVADASGRAIATKALEPGTEGRFAWDGALDAGGTAPHGTYSLTLKALDSSGRDVSAKIRSVGTVNSVSAASGSILLSVNGAELPTSTLLTIAARTGA
jgi:flagellar basal-body rod modification protein FlgD